MPHKYNLYIELEVSGAPNIIYYTLLLYIINNRFIIYNVIIYYTFIYYIKTLYKNIYKTCFIYIKTYIKTFIYYIKTFYILYKNITMNIYYCILKYLIYLSI